MGKVFLAMLQIKKRPYLSISMKNKFIKYKVKQNFPSYMKFLEISYRQIQNHEENLKRKGLNVIII